MVIDSGNGVYNLLVRNVTISDDAQYQCQVSPGPAAGSKPIRSSARLTVLSEFPPVSYTRCVRVGTITADEFC